MMVGYAGSSRLPPMTRENLSPAQAAQMQQHALTLLRQGQAAAARDVLDRLCKSSPRLSGAWMLLSGAHGALGEFAAAERCARKAIRLEPKNAWAHSNLGNALLELGRPEEALRAFTVALHHAPGFFEARSNLSSVLKLLGRHAEAEEMLREVVRTNPLFAPAWNNLASCLDHRGRPFEALPYMLKAIEIAPANAEYHANLAALLGQVGEHDAEFAHYRKALALDPARAKTLVALIGCCVQAGLDEEADRYFERLRELDVDGTLTAIAEAGRRERQGDPEGAWERIAAVLGRGDDNPEMFIVLARIATGMRDSELMATAAARLEAILEGRRQSLPASGRMQLHFALGALHDKLRHWETAFVHYASGNPLKQVIFDSEDDRRRTDETIAAWRPERFARMPSSGNESETPVFIVGMPRSGTTLVEQILDSHPLVHGAGELPDMKRVVTALRERLGADRPLPEQIGEATAETMAAAAAEYLGALVAHMPEAARITDKMPHNFLNVPYIAKLFPRARIIHCRRDPLDTCLSIWFQNFAQGHGYAYDLGNLGRHYRHYRRLMRYWKDVLGIPMLEVRYEEMVADQERVSREIVAWCGLEWDDHCLSFHENERVVRTASYQQVRQPIYRSSSGRSTHYRPFLGPLIEALGS